MALNLNAYHSHLAIKNLKALRIRSSLSKCRAKDKGAPAI